VPQSSLLKLLDRLNLELMDIFIIIKLANMDSYKKEEWAVVDSETPQPLQKRVITEVAKAPVRHLGRNTRSRTSYLNLPWTNVQKQKVVSKTRVLQKP
jgi:hypothetical protein